MVSVGGGGIDGDLAAVEAVFDGVLAGVFLALRSFGSGGFLGILPAGLDFLFTCGHSLPLFLKRQARILGGFGGEIVRRFRESTESGG